MSADDPTQPTEATTSVLDEITSHPRGADLARLVLTAAFAAADERRTSLGDGIHEIAERAGIKPEDAETSYGNVLRALERGTAEAAGSATRALLAGLCARGVALAPPEGAAAEARVAEKLVWLAVHTSIDALSFLDVALVERADGMWRAIGALVRKADAGTAPLVGRAGAVIATVALSSSTSFAARDEARVLAAEARDPILRALASYNAPGGAPSSASSAGASDRDVALTGELVSPPRGPIALVLLGISGILAALGIARAVGKAALRYKKPAEMVFSSRGVTLRYSIELLGKKLREREAHIPKGSLLRAAREVRYPRLGLYAGLFSLALGSYLGMKILIDGARSGSPEMVGIGALFVIVGVSLDYVLENVWPARAGRCRVVVVPRQGPSLAVGDVDPKLAEAALEQLIRSAS